MLVIDPNIAIWNRHSYDDARRLRESQSGNGVKGDRNPRASEDYAEVAYSRGTAGKLKVDDQGRRPNQARQANEFPWYDTDRDGWLGPNYEERRANTARLAALSNESYESFEMKRNANEKTNGGRGWPEANADPVQVKEKVHTTYHRTDAPKSEDTPSTLDTLV